MPISMLVRKGQENDVPAFGEAQGVKRRFSVKRGAGSKTAFQRETPFERTRQRSRENP